MKRRAFSLLCLTCTLFLVNSLSACTDFLLTAQDRSIINGRSMEFAQNLASQIVVKPRGQKVQSLAPNNQKGLNWTSRYGYIYANAFNQDIVTDGFNEKGLSFGYLWLPTTVYQTPQNNSNKPIIDFMDLGAWILGNFASIDELKSQLEQITVWGHDVPELNFTPPLHVALHDAQGKSLVIEFLNGTLKFYDNPNSVLTNYPPFEWQLTNLQNYVHLSAVNAKPATFGGIEYQQTGQGSGLIGLPGDSTPPSRFVRISTYLRFVKQPKDALTTVNLAEHLLNTVDIPYGAIDSNVSGQQLPSSDYTQWAVIKDLSHLVLYYRTYENLNVQAIDLTKIDLKEGAQPRVFPFQVSNP